MMPLNQVGITLITTDSRPRYTNDVLSVLAHPEGTVYKFRYESKYLPSNILHFFENGHVEGTKCLIVFRSSAEAGNKSTFMIPIRWGKIMNVKKTLNFYVVNFKVTGYPNCTSIVNLDDLSPLVTEFENYIGTIPENLRNLPVQEGFPAFIGPQETNNEEAWLNVAIALSKHHTYSKCHFLKVSAITDNNGNVRQTSTNNGYEIFCDQYSYLTIDHYASEFEDINSRVNIEADQKILRIASHCPIQLSSRYDSDKIWFQTQKVSGRTHTQVKIETVSGSEKQPVQLPVTKVLIPMLIRKSPSNAIVKTVVATLGATLVAVPGIVGDDWSTWITIPVALAGALLLAMIAKD